MNIIKSILNFLILFVIFILYNLFLFSTNKIVHISDENSLVYIEIDSDENETKNTPKLEFKSTRELHQKNLNVSE